MASSAASGPAHRSVLRDASTLTEAIRLMATRCPQQDAFIFRHPNTSQRLVMTFADLYQLGGRWARELHDKGIGRNHYVVNALPNSPERVVVEWAILMSGAASVNGICQLKDASDLTACLRQSEATALVLDPDFMPNAYSALLVGIPGPQPDGSVASQSFPSLRYVLSVQRRNGPDDFLARLRNDTTTEIYQENQQKEEDVCTVMTTSGTGGFSKLVAFTHGTLVTAGKRFSRPRSSRELNIGLMGWSGAYAGNASLNGNTRVCCDVRAGSPDDLSAFIFQSCKEEGVTGGNPPCHVFPALAEKVEALNGGEPLFELLGVGTQPITRQIIKYASKIGRRIFVPYASTEMLFVSAYASADGETFEDFCAGSIVPGVEVKIQDKQGQEVGPQVHGQILVRSPFRFQAYLNDAASTQAAFTEDGFFLTGDLGWLSGDGQLFVEGRGKDAITRGNYIFYPGWLEARMLACPAVQDVLVVGVADPVLTSELCACIVLQGGHSMSQVRAFVESDILAEDTLSPRPRYYLQFNSILHTPTGKPDRRQMAMAAEKKVKEAIKE